MQYFRIALWILAVILVCQPFNTHAQDALLVIAWSRTPEALFTDFATTATAAYAMMPIYNGLVDSDQYGNIVPELAESWELSADRRTWTFTLRQGVVWHDGQPFTAADVRFSYEFPSDPDYRGDSFDDSILGAVERRAGQAETTLGLQIIDDLTIAITTTEPNSTFLQTTAQRYIVPEHNLGGIPVAELGSSSQIRAPVGTGPYRVVSYRPDEAIIYERFDGYWGAIPRIKRIIWRIIPTVSVQITELLNGTVDIVPEVPADEFTYLQNDPTVSTQHLTGINSPHILINFEQPYFTDVRTRQALYFAIDRQGLVNAVAAGYGQVYDSLLHPSQPEFNPNLRSYPFDPTVALRLLHEVGWRDDDGDGILEAHGIAGLTDGTSFRVELVTLANPPIYRLAAQVIQQNLQQIGIDITINAVNLSVFFSQYVAPGSNYVLALTGWFNFVLPTHTEFEINYSTDGYNNIQRTHWQNTEMDNLLGQARTTFDESERILLYWRVQNLLQQEAPVIYLFRPDTLIAYRRAATLPDIVSLTALMDSTGLWAKAPP